MRIRRQHVIAFSISILLVGLITYVVEVTGGTAQYSEYVSNLNRFKYIAMAQNPLSDEDLVHDGLFAWRVLTPSLVFLLPMKDTIAFHVTTTVGLVLTLYFTYMYLRSIRFGHRESILGLFFFALLPGAFRFNLWDFFLADPLALAFVAMAFYMMETRRYFLLALVLLIGVTNKEFMLFVIPVYVIFAMHNYGATRQFVLNSLIVCAPAILAYIILRVFITSYSPVDSMDRIPITLGVRFQDIREGLYQPYIHSIGTWGVLFPLVLVDYRAKITWLLERKELLFFLLLVYAQLLFAVDDRRHLVYAFPVMIPLALYTVRFFAAALKPHYFFVILVFLAVVQISFLFQQDMPVQFRLAIAGALALAWPLLECAKLLAGHEPWKAGSGAGRSTNR